MCGWKSIPQGKSWETQGRLDFESLLRNGKTHMPNCFKAEEVFTEGTTKASM